MECGPKNCGILGFDLLTPAEKREQRKSRAAVLYKQGFTEQQIADQFSVSVQTISTDLKEFSSDLKTPPRTSKRGRKGEGRPKGSKRRPKAPKAHYRNEELISLFDQQKSYAQIEAETGIGQRRVRDIIERELIRRDAEPEIDPVTLDVSAKEKLAIALRQQNRKLNLEFQQRVLDEVRKRIDEIVLPNWKNQIDEAKKLYDRRRALMKKDTFNTIRRALHPDSRNAISDNKLGEAFDAFMKLEKYLLDETDSPTEFGKLPSSLAEWDKMRAKVRHPSGPTAMSRR